MCKELDTYVWKEAKLTNNPDEVAVSYKLMDMEEEHLNIAYNHCKHMLYNTDVKNPGRMIVVNNISQQINNCGAELALRWFKTLKDKDGNALYTDSSLMSDLRNWLASTPEKTNNKIYTLQDFVQVPPDFKNVTIEAMQEACTDTLGLFDHSKITFSFLFRLGVYFTSRELNEIENFTESNTLEEKFEVLKTQLGLKDEAVIQANPRGLSEQEFRDMIHMKKMKGHQKCKYSELTTSQLTTLRHKVLYAFENQVIKQARTWTTLMRQIEEVAEYKGFKLD